MEKIYSKFFLAFILFLGFFSLSHSEELEVTQDVVGFIVDKARKGDAISQHLLGGFYHRGVSFSQDYVKAREWYETSAVRGYVEAQYNLGVLYSNGFGVHQNYAAAREWFGQACDNGFQKGCDMYRDFGNRR